LTLLYFVVDFLPGLLHNGIKQELQIFDAISKCNNAFHLKAKECYGLDKLTLVKETPAQKAVNSLYNEFYRRLLDWSLQSNPKMQFILLEPFALYHTAVTEEWRKA